MNLRPWLAVALACSIGPVSATPARAQWHYPGGYGGFGWDGWGATSVHGDMARGMGMFAAGAGVYNKFTGIGEKQAAVAESINADTVKRWNEYIYQSQQAASRRLRNRQDRESAANAQRRADLRKRLRDDPDPSDIHRGDALNIALEEINDPKVFDRALRAADAKLGGDLIRAIPFQYAPAGLTMGIHQLATGTLPASLRTPEFEADRRALKALDEQVLNQVDEDKVPDPDTVRKFLAAIATAEEKAAAIVPANGLGAKQAVKYLKALHGLVAMLKAPSLDPYLAGVEKRPDATLGELLEFMVAFNLRFGPATTPQQREAYNALFPKLAALRDKVAQAPADESNPEPSTAGAEDFFSAMSLDDLKKQSPKP